jgi:Tetratricopeptide repeat
VTGWPPWRRAQPAQLARYVHTGVLARVVRPGLRLPGRSGAPPEVRVRQLFEAFADAGVRYADEQPAAAGEQDIRTPDQVFLRPGLGNCLDLAVAFAGGCLDAGLHPMIVTLSPAGPGGAAHAIVIVWLRGDLDGAVPYPLTEGVHNVPPQWPGMGLRGSWDAPGEFVAVDVARAAHGWPPGDSRVGFDEAVTAAAGMFTGGAWVWEHGVDVGLTHGPTVAHPLPGWPERDPLEPPYHPPAPDGDDLGPLQSVRARNRIVPFEPRQALDELYDWCLAPDSAPGESRLRLMVVHGVGGSGKTRLAAELATRLSETDGWYAGFLRRDLTRPDAPIDEVVWLSGVVGPVLVVLDYVEAADRTALAEALAVLATRRDRTVVLLTARYPGDWRTSLANKLGSRGVHPEARPDTRLDALHPRVEGVYRRAYRRFSPTSGAPDLPPELPAASTGWTTLDVVMLGWLAARNPRAQPPADQAKLYEEILGREFDNWNADLRSRFGREADPAALRRAAAIVSLLSPTAQMVPAALRAVRIGEMTSLAVGEIAGMLGRFLTDPTEQVLALRPDPLADHLIVTDLHPGEDFDRCVDLVAGGDRGRTDDGQAVLRLVNNLTRAADQNPATAGALATATLRRHPKLWPAALGTVWTRGGPFVAPLEELARHDDTPLPLQELAHHIPLSHGALRTLALIAAQRSRPALDPEEHDSDALNQAADAWNTLSLRQSETGDRAGALTSITEAVQIRRELVEQNPAAFLPDLAMSLNNLSVRQSETGDRAGALTSITEAVQIRRELVEQNPAAFLPNLAASLNTLSALLVTLDGDPVQAVTAWDDAGAVLPAASRAELLCHRSGWHRNRSDTTAAIADLSTAAALIDLDGPFDDPRALAHARQYIRTCLATFDPSDLSKVPFPSWVITPIPEAVIDLANRWIAADWSQRQQILTAPDMPTDRDLLRVLAAVYCDHPELRHWLDVIDDIDARGRDVVFAEMDAAQATVSLLQDWINTPSWNASQAFLTGHPALRGADAVAVLEKWSGNDLARQHLAILRLTEHVPAGEVFDGILDPTDARQLLLRVARTGSAELITEAWYATPHIAADPFAGSVAAALVQVLSDETDYPDELDQALRVAAAAASSSECRDTLTLLRALATTRDDRAESLHQIAAAITPASERSD